MIYLFTCNEKGILTLLGHYYYYESKILCLYENSWYVYKKDSRDFVRSYELDNISTHEYYTHVHNDVEVYSYKDLDDLLDDYITKIIFDKL